MTTRTRRARSARLLRCALLLAIAWFSVPGRAEATVTGAIVGTQLRITGDGGSNGITLKLSIDEARIELWDGLLFVSDFQRALFTTILVDAGGGNDTVTIDETVAVFTDTEITTINGGDGNDTINGGVGSEMIHGGPGHDTIDAGRGNDTLWGDAGIDHFIWSAGNGFIVPTDGNDVIDGGDDQDTLSVTGTSLDEVYNAAPDAQRVVLTRSGGAITLGLGGIEIVEVAMQGGNDTFGASPGIPVSVIFKINGGDGNDTMLGADGNDQFWGGNGDDIIGGGPGNDLIYGEAGADLLIGDAGADSFDSGPGDDDVRGGAGNDAMMWMPGDGSDDFDGGDGNDSITLGGDAINGDLYRIAGPPAGGFMVNHNVFAADITCLQVERMEFATRGGDDAVMFFTSANGRFEQANVDLSEGNDQLDLPVMTGHVFASGGAGQDALTYHAQNQPVAVTASTISLGGTERLLHFAFEDVNVVETVGQLPQVTIVAPTASPSTTSAVPFIALGGTAADPDGSIQAVSWSSSRGYSGTANGTSTWTLADVPLMRGPNTITVSALDNAGNSSSDQITVTVNELSYSLAEGATGSFFDLDVLLANPWNDTVPVTIFFLRQGDTTLLHTQTLPPMSRTTLHLDQMPGLENQSGISAIVKSSDGYPIVVERTMFWDQNYYGSHGGTAVDGPRTRWLFAEGSEGFVNTFVLLANGNSTAADVTLTFLREGSTPFTRTVTVQPSSRLTVATNGIPELVGRSFSIVVDATQPIIAERAMYFGTARLFDGGHESAGVPAGATSWFLAEGATGSFFTTFVLVGNPNPAAANVTFTFLTATGQTVVRNKVVPANGRLTVNVATEDPMLASAAVSTTVTADQPVIAERAMYWPGPPSTWAEAHNSFGATTLGTKWGLSEGRVGMAHAFQTYILLANPSTTAANVQITFLRANGAPVVKTFTVAPTSRFNVAVNTAAPELQGEEFGALIEVTNGVGISVERAMYSDALGQVWAAGTNALGTRLP
jgi:Ca2+-binding RTX toxin-like protein